MTDLQHIGGYCDPRTTADSIRDVLCAARIPNCSCSTPCPNGGDGPGCACDSFRCAAVIVVVVFRKDQVWPVGPVLLHTLVHTASESRFAMALRAYLYP
ncbi:hypothetical protein CY34DRAFT_660834 [Suillus luteus UH-Slu-Lm8-n1]|uniref:Uncharacterized protein n=1 Tax=Suillus luteus UH-Slu-Lm8-n1 TaxID=930992 RepID=A0A0D0A278_9AGAM|nr:hypothetical protein CY34DRAFT_660834 [Suillus luteus UH-Slu-Lm8-n1]